MTKENMLNVRKLSTIPQTLLSVLLPFHIPQLVVLFAEPGAR
jgi:hypothetical protein